MTFEGRILQGNTGETTNINCLLSIKWSCISREIRNPLNLVQFGLESFENEMAKSKDDVGSF